MTAMIVDFLIIALLTGCVGYGFLVHRRVKILMASLKELEPLILDFSSAVDKSEASVNQMRENLEGGRQYSKQEQAGASVDTALDTSGNAPVFATGRFLNQGFPGVQVIRDKQELVRRFFDTSRTESKA